MAACEMCVSEDVGVSQPWPGTGVRPRGRLRERPGLEPWALAEGDISLWTLSLAPTPTSFLSTLWGFALSSGNRYENDYLSISLFGTHTHRSLIYWFIL